MTPTEILIVIAIPVTAELLTIFFKNKYFHRVFYKIKPQNKILKARIELLIVGDTINYAGYINGKKTAHPRQVRVDDIDDETITVRFLDMHSKKYIRLLPNKELILLAFN
jgi:hypothetical protein